MHTSDIHVPGHVATYHSCFALYAWYIWALRKLRRVHYLKHTLYSMYSFIVGNIDLKFYKLKFRILTVSSFSFITVCRNIYLP